VTAAHRIGNEAMGEYFVPGVPQSAGRVQAAVVSDCYVDRLLDQPGQHDQRLVVIFDECRSVERWDVETPAEQRGEVDQTRDMAVWARTVVVWNEFFRVLIVDHFVPVNELYLAAGYLPSVPGVWPSGKYSVAGRVLAALGWEHAHGPGEQPVRRRQAVCERREAAVRQAVAAADEWIRAVGEAAKSVREEIEREQAVKVLAQGAGYQGSDDGIPI
jgi:hypothetical protein